MAVDEWFFDRAQQVGETLWVRLYSWSEPAITFGVNQDSQCAFDGARLGSTPVIRRITGGRALYHDCSELTYCVAVNLSAWADLPWGTGRSSFQRCLAEALVEFVTASGWEADYCRRSAERDAQPAFFHKAACFASSARYEVVAGGVKVAASAACQRGAAIMQHGSIKLDGVAHHPALYYPATNDVTGTDGLRPLSRRRWVAAGERFFKILSARLGVDLARAELGPAEMAELESRAGRLRKAAWECRIFLNR